MLEEVIRTFLEIQQNEHNSHKKCFRVYPTVRGLDHVPRYFREKNVQAPRYLYHRHIKAVVNGVNHHQTDRSAVLLVTLDVITTSTASKVCDVAMFYLSTTRKYNIRNIKRINLLNRLFLRIMSKNAHECTHDSRAHD